MHIPIKPTINSPPSSPSCAMPAASPFDPLLPLLAAAQRTGPTVWGSVMQLDVTFTTGLKMPLMLVGSLGAAPPATSDPGDFDPTPLQSRIIQLLASGAKSAKQMRDKIGSHLYDSAGGINDLIGYGVVEKKFAKFRLTDDVGQAIAAEIGDEEIEE